ncbi:MAG: prolyl oligopeptidase family serine peptidase [Pirellulales bacterium]|nr:prolyl oligopeptidase family serine peptidase [Pirellulales bacterium]
MPYRLLKPAGLDRRDGKHPLLVFLHGIGERGTDNRVQLRHGRPLMKATARDYRALVLVPQCPPTATWAARRWNDTNHALPDKPTEPLRLLVELIEQLKTRYPIDPARVHVMGLSMGGYGTWELIERYPDRFAAAMPVCGGGDESQAKRLTGLPIWAFHGSADRLVPPIRSRGMIEAIRKAGGQPKYTQYEGVGHNSWDRAFAEPELLKWLFAQRRGQGNP